MKELLRNLRLRLSSSGSGREEVLDREMSIIRNCTLVHDLDKWEKGLIAHMAYMLAEKHLDLQGENVPDRTRQFWDMNIGKVEGLLEAINTRRGYILEHVASRADSSTQSSQVTGRAVRQPIADRADLPEDFLEHKTHLYTTTLRYGQVGSDWVVTRHS